MKGHAGKHVSGDPHGVEVRELWPPGFRYVVIDHRLDGHPGVGVYGTNGRVFWGQETAETWAAWYKRKHGAVPGRSCL